ncbi:MAG TPA: hypothetical protein V6C97_26385, partial [Oculatellaceae cyanobacterium]
PLVRTISLPEYCSFLWYLSYCLLMAEALSQEERQSNERVAAVHAVLSKYRQAEQLSAEDVLTVSKAWKAHFSAFGVRYVAGRYGVECVRVVNRRRTNIPISELVVTMANERIPLFTQEQYAHADDDGFVLPPRVYKADGAPAAGAGAAGAAAGAGVPDRGASAGARANGHVDGGPPVGNVDHDVVMEAKEASRTVPPQRSSGASGVDAAVVDSLVNRVGELHALVARLEQRLASSPASAPSSTSSSLSSLSSSSLSSLSAASSSSAVTDQRSSSSTAEAKRSGNVDYVAKIRAYENVQLESFAADVLLASARASTQERKHTVSLSSTVELSMDSTARKRRVRLSTWNDWCTVALHFFSLFVSIHPERASDIAAYVKWCVGCHLMRVRDATIIMYDRLLRQERTGANGMFASLDSNIWTMCSSAELVDDDDDAVPLTQTLSSVSSSSSLSSQAAGAARRHCAEYHTSVAGCTRGAACPYDHCCPWCTARHPARTCHWQVRLHQQRASQPSARSASGSRQFVNKRRKSSSGGGDGKQSGSGRSGAADS